MTVNYSVIVSCSAHFPPGGRNSGSTTDRVIADSRYNESRYSEARLYINEYHLKLFYFVTSCVCMYIRHVRRSLAAVRSNIHG